VENYITKYPVLFIEVINTFSGADSQRLPDEHGSTLFQFFFNPDAVPMEHLTSEAIQVNRYKGSRTKAPRT
jgi:hypothetical protein